MASHKKLDKPVTSAPIEEVTALPYPKQDVIRLVVQVSRSLDSRKVITDVTTLIRQMLSTLNKEHHSIIKVENCFIYVCENNGKKI